MNAERCQICWDQDYDQGCFAKDHPGSGCLHLERLAQENETLRAERKRLRDLCMEHGCGHILMIFDGS